MSFPGFRRLPCRRRNSTRLHQISGKFTSSQSDGDGVCVCVCVCVSCCDSTYSGLAGGEENGRRGYQMTFTIAYIRVSSSVSIYLSDVCTLCACRI